MNEQPSHVQQQQQQQRRRRLLLVKYGGSAVTIKDRLETLNPEALHSCADHVRELLLQTNAAVIGPDDCHLTEIVIVHGAGKLPTLPYLSTMLMTIHSMD